MPINEYRAHQSNLTPQQQREAMASIYGLDARSAMTPTPDLTYEQRVALRQALDVLDQKDAAAGRREFDLAKPPVAPYMYKEFPFVLYNHSTRKAQAVHNHEQRDQMLADGWSVEPFPAEPPLPPPLTAEERAAIEEIDRKLEKKRRV